MIVYLTGGIGTGKSTVLEMFGALGAETLSADRIVRDLYARPDVQAAVADLLALPIPLDKRSIAERVFADAEARTSLERLLHPLVRRESDRIFAELPEDAVMVYEIPLPPEPRCGDAVCLVTAPLDLRIERLLARGMTEADARARIAAQPGDTLYGKHAAHTIVNEGDLDALRAQVRHVWEELRHGQGPV